MNGQYSAPPTGFVVNHEIAIYGGFAGGEASPALRQGGPTYIEGSGSSKHVFQVVNIGAVSTTPVILDRLQIRGGNANGTVTSFPDNVGGGIYSTGFDVNLVDCFIYTDSASTSGGGIWFHGGAEGASTLNLKRCEIVQNAAGTGTGGGDGGGLWTRWVKGNIVSTTFSSNTTSNHGGGVYLEDMQLGTNFNIAGSQFWANAATSATTSHGGGIYLGQGGGNGAWVSLFNCTMASNYAATNGPGQAIYGSNSNPTAVLVGARNSIIFFNKGPTPGILPQPLYPSTSPDLAYCDIDNPPPGHGSTWNGTAMMNQDPVFKQLANGRLRLQGLGASPSPCIGAGNALSIPLDILDVDDDSNTNEQLPLDLEGSPRQVLVVDMGAFEYH